MPGDQLKQAWHDKFQEKTGPRRGAQNLVKPIEKHHFCPSKKKTSPGILRLFETMQKPLVKQRFEHGGVRLPGKESMRCLAAREGSAMALRENHWENKHSRVRGHVKHRAVSWFPLRALGNLTVIGSNSKTIGETCFCWCTREPTVPSRSPFPMKSRQSGIGNPWETVGKTSFSGAAANLQFLPNPDSKLKNEQLFAL